MDDDDGIVIGRRSSKKIVPDQRGSGAKDLGICEYAGFAYPSRGARLQIERSTSSASLAMEWNPPFITLFQLFWQRLDRSDDEEDCTRAAFPDSRS
jgi:hypothetical protein